MNSWLFFCEEIALGPNSCHILRREYVPLNEIQFAVVYLTSLNMGPVCHPVVFNLKMGALKVGIN